MPFAGAAIVGLAFGRWRVLAACLLSAVLSLVYFVELRASSEVGQYISGEMLHDFIGWSATHPSGAADYVTIASMIKLAALLTVLAGLLLALARRHHGAVPARAATRCGCCSPRPAIVAVALTVVVAPVAYAVRLPQSPLNTSAVARAASTLASRGPAATVGSPWLSLDDALGSLRRMTHTAVFDRRARVRRRARPAPI